MLIDPKKAYLLNCILTTINIWTDGCITIILLLALWTYCGPKSLLKWLKIQFFYLWIVALCFLFVFSTALIWAVLNPNRWINILYLQICSKQKIKWRFLLKNWFLGFFYVMLIGLHMLSYCFLHCLIFNHLRGFISIYLISEKFFVFY